ncbi:MAG: hypothetical protein GTO03_13620, partial [Planctomycetales bacterium]|nr:hypothetical protein [Planctomycetales bacterium]
MGRGNFRTAAVACLASLPMVDRAFGADRTFPRPLQATKLYLNAGTIDTRSAQSGPDLLLHRPKSYAAGIPYVLQMDGPITPQRRAALVQAGVKLGDYLPRNAYIVDLSGVRPQAIDDLPFVSWIGAYRNEWKLSP